MVAQFRDQDQLLSKMATGNGHGEDSPYFDGWKAYDKDPYHPTERPNGVIQMGLAENQLCFDLIQEWLMKNPEASICTPDGVENFKDIALFQDYHGLPEFREAIAKFMGKVRGGRVKFNPDRIVMSGGATGAHETMAFCLAEPGDAFLVPTPYYAGFDRDLRWRTRVQLAPVVCESCNNFKITKSALEAAYENAKEANIRVKGLLITNPSNPLGNILDRETLKGIPNFISFSEVIEEDIECNRDLIHIVYSLSKDMGFPGFRVGIVYSYNDAVVNCARKMSSFGLVSTQTQHLIASMLSDDEFVDRNQLFVWMDLRMLLKDPSFEAEIELWKVIISEVKLNVSPGSSFHCLEPGWFRVCFANMDDNTMEVALSRIKAFMHQIKDQNREGKVLAKKPCRQSSLKLSLSRRRVDDFLMSQISMSPHSPTPQSPLVPARN
ncbi:hypothetical protein SLA2020_315150 [Shorea laevis]